MVQLERGGRGGVRVKRREGERERVGESEREREERKEEQDTNR